jgi:prepilin-type processing-associated H-X9-DG protein
VCATPLKKIVFIEEDPLTIHDGHWAPPMINPDDPNDPLTNTGAGDLMCIRHDMLKAKPDSATPAPYSATNFPNADKRGNAAFADGHAEYVSRKFAHDPRHLDPLR